jgi:hypothetical protein
MSKVLIDESKDSKEMLSELDKQLSNYTALEVEDETSENDETEEKEDFTDKSDPDLYYQSGKKRGQLRPKANDKLGVTIRNETKVIKGNNLLTGLMMLTFIDLIFPLVITVVNNRFTKKSIKSHQLKLSKTQKNELTPLADEVVKMLDIEANPLHMLIISMIGVYGLNLMEARNE